MSEIGLFEAMFSTRALRRLKPDSVPDALITKIIEAGTQAPVVSRGWWKSEKASRSGELSHNSRPLGGGCRRMTLWRGIARVEGREKARWKN